MAAGNSSQDIPKFTAKSLYARVRNFKYYDTEFPTFTHNGTPIACPSLFFRGVRQRNPNEINNAGGMLYRLGEMGQITTGQLENVLCKNSFTTRCYTYKTVKNLQRPVLSRTEKAGRGGARDIHDDRSGFRIREESGTRFDWHERAMSDWFEEVLGKTVTYQQFRDDPSVSRTGAKINMEDFQDVMWVWARFLAKDRYNEEGMKGITSCSVYWSEKFTSTGMHVEDCCFCGLNLMTYGGSKLWMVVNPYFTEKLRQQLMKELGITCGNVFFGKNYLFSPEELKRRGIPYKVIIQRPGDLLYITSGSAHQVINMDFSLNESLNIIDPDDMIQIRAARNLRECRCGLDEPKDKAVVRKYEKEGAYYRKHEQYMFTEFDLGLARAAYEEYHRPEDFSDHPVVEDRVKKCQLMLRRMPLLHESLANGTICIEDSTKYPTISVTGSQDLGEITYPSNPGSTRPSTPAIFFSMGPPVEPLIGDTVMGDRISKIPLHVNTKLPGRFSCRFCSEFFTLYQSLVNHERDHSKQRVTCSLCPVTLTQKRNLPRHMRNAHGQL